MGIGGYLSVLSESPGALRSALNESGWIDQEVIAAGQLRQGKAPTTLGMITGHALIEVARPRRSKSLPRMFVLAVTGDRVLAFKAFGGGGGTDATPYTARIRPGVDAERPRSTVRLLDLHDGAPSKEATLAVGGGGGTDATPYTARIRPGVYAEWPRSTVRLLDLHDGALSKEATLAVGGGEKLTVSRANLDGDPNTDELMRLLSGGTDAVRAQS